MGDITFRGGKMPSQFKCKATWSDGSETQHDFSHYTPGVNRVVFICNDREWVVKVQAISQSNQSIEEWRSYNRLEALRGLVPTLRGYAEARIDDTTHSFLFMDRIGFTFGRMLHDLAMQPLTATSLGMVTNAAQTVVRTLIECVRKGITPYDWHVDNIGFEDNDAGTFKLMKLVDFYGNTPSAAADTYRQRMDNAFKQFTRRIPNRIFEGPRGARYPKERYDIPAAKLPWHTALLAVQQTLDEWWSSWCASKRAPEEIPDSSDQAQLRYRLDAVRLSSVLRQQERKYRRSESRSIKRTKIPIGTNLTVSNNALHHGRFSTNNDTLSSNTNASAAMVVDGEDIAAGQRARSAPAAMETATVGTIGRQDPAGTPEELPDEEVLLQKNCWDTMRERMNAIVRSAPLLQPSTPVRLPANQHDEEPVGHHRVRTHKRKHNHGEAKHDRSERRRIKRPKISMETSERQDPVGTPGIAQLRERTPSGHRRDVRAPGIAQLRERMNAIDRDTPSWQPSHSVILPANQHDEESVVHHRVTEHKRKRRHREPKHMRSESRSKKRPKISTSSHTVANDTDASAATMVQGEDTAAVQRTQPVPATTERQTHLVTETSTEARAVVESLTEVVGHPTAAVAVGQAAAKALLDRVMAEQRAHAQAEYRQGRKRGGEDVTPVEGRNIPLQERLDRQIFDERHGAPAFEKAVLDDVAIFFRLFLHKISQHGYDIRMPKLPRGVQEPPRFHRKHAKKFAASAPGPWLSLSMPMKRQHLWNWLFKKFTRDKYRRCMWPRNPAMRLSRNEICWTGFYLTDEELYGLVQEICQGYYETTRQLDRHQSKTSGPCQRHQLTDTRALSRRQ